MRVLPSDWSVTAIDIDEQRLQAAQEIRPTLTTVLGDASSRLVLQRAGLRDDWVLVVCSGQMDVNREVCRIARRELGVEEVSVRLGNTHQLEDVGLRADDVVLAHRAAASMLVNRVVGREQRAVAVGLGAGELRQVTVFPGSQVVGARLMDLDPHRWLVAAVYRNGGLLVPHGETKLEVGDRVLLVGEPEVMDTVSAFVRGDRPIFPSQFGSHIAAATVPEISGEAAWLVEATCGAAGPSFDPQAVHPRTHDDAAIRAWFVEHDVGVAVLAAHPLPLTTRLGLTQSSRKRMMCASKVPLLVARGTHPYKTILVAIGPDQDCEAIAGVAIDLSRQLQAKLVALTVVLPSLAEGTAEQVAARALPRRVATMGRLHGVSVEERVDVGNPIRVIRKHAADAHLLIVGHSPSARNSLLNPDISLFLLHDSPCSTLFVPWHVAGR